MFGFKHRDYFLFVFACLQFGTVYMYLGYVRTFRNALTKTCPVYVFLCICVLFICLRIKVA